MSQDRLHQIKGGFADGASQCDGRGCSYTDVHLEQPLLGDIRAGDTTKGLPVGCPQQTKVSTRGTGG